LISMSYAYIFRRPVFVVSERSQFTFFFFARCQRKYS